MLVKMLSLSHLIGGQSRWPKKAATSTSQASWKPNALRPVTLITAIMIAWALITISQILLVRSQTDGGVIIATTIDDFTLAQSFLYRYLPTIIALVFSIFWNWIDLQTKRIEPYYQLSKPDGAWGKDSLLISYPFDFLPFVPMSALRSRHWAVFWGSMCIVFVTWGLVPLQAGLFATEGITQTSTAVFAKSVGFMPASEQAESITGRYIHSAHGIIWLNETLPPFMTRDYVVAPFRPHVSGNSPMPDETWTADTTLYSVDMSCEVPTIKIEDTPRVSGKTRRQTVQASKYVSKSGCEFPTDYYSTLGNDTIGPNESFQNQSIYDTKQFSSVYVGYYSTDASDYYLQGLCPKTANHTFMALFTRNKKVDKDPAQNVTRLYCTPFYYQQEVSATIDANTKRPFNIITKGDKQVLPADKWNSSFFEYQMGSGKNNERTRDTLPLKYWPDQLETVSTMSVSLGTGGAILEGMAGFILGASNSSLEQLLDPEALRAAYEATYRVIFARSMIEILDQDFTNLQISNGSIGHTMAAVVVVPVFAYTVEGLLGVISICSIALLIISVRRKWSLHSDPATIASVMALVSDNPALLKDFAKLDRASMEVFQQSLKDKKYQLEYNERGNVIRDTDSLVPLNQDAHDAPSECSQTAKPFRPREFRSFMVVPFISLLAALAITLGVLWTKARPYGIMRPSDNAIVRQIVENYIPTALATLVEPVWVMVNRLLCMLQPLEELRGGGATARKSIDADYSSLPPQLVVFKAIRSSHFKLAAVCTMALLSNLLAVAFSGMFNEAPIMVPLKWTLQPPYQSKFVTINGTVRPNMPYEERLNMTLSGAFTGGLGSNQFLVAESNYTAGTAMPAWTDARFFYMPFANSTALKTKNIKGINARTTAVGAELECSQIDARQWTARWNSDEFLASSSNVTVKFDDVHCEVMDLKTTVGPSDSGTSRPVCETGRVAMEHVLLLKGHKNSSLAVQEYCAQSIVFGYFRDGNICSRNTTTVFNERNAVFVGCHSNLVAGEADVFVDERGQVQNATDLDVSSKPSAEFLERHFSNDAKNLLQQGNGYILQFPGATWHNQSFASEFMNYFMIKQSNSSRLVDPNLPLPSFEDITRALYPVYSKLFAIWLGINKDKLLLPRDESSTFSMDAQAYERQVRIFLALPLFIIAQAILGIYIIVAICIFLWRPGRFLLRMPTSIGAIIALFAASEAVRELRGTSLFTKKERKKHLDDLGRTYGYGTFVGTDRETHDGIEKEPLVNVVPFPGVLSKMQTGFSQKGSLFNRGSARTSA